MRQIRTIGLLLIVISLLYVPLMRTLCIGVNDAEWSHIQRTGTLSGQTKVKWATWEPSGVEHRRPAAWGASTPVDEFRRGEAESNTFLFIVYEARNPISSWPVIGPNWGCHVRLYIPIIIGIVGLIFTISTRTKKVGHNMLR